MSEPKPYITVLSKTSGGGFGVGFSEDAALYATGQTLDEALKNLSLVIAQDYHLEKGDETPDADISARQANILNNDRFIRGNQLQESVLKAFALGLV
jgi:predicted RNase H-like HicB family nuclease